MKLDWIKCKGNAWCKLKNVNLGHEHFNNRHGVYIIWHGGESPSVVYVGQGHIKDRLEFHRQNPDVQKFANSELYVTWATVLEATRDGIEVYLATKFNPKAGANYPQAVPMEVNSPW